MCSYKRVYTISSNHRCRAAGPLFIKWTDVLRQDLAKSRSCEFRLVQSLWKLLAFNWKPTVVYCSNQCRIGISCRVLICICGPNLEILTSVGGDLSCRQAQNGVNFYFKCNLILKVTVNQKKSGILTKVFYISGPNLVFPAYTVDEFSWQACDQQTREHTNTHSLRQRQCPKAKTDSGYYKPGWSS